MACLMARKLYYPAILIGALLLLLAVVVAMRLDTTADHSFVQQRTAVVETVSHLDGGCLTCHQSTRTYTPSLTIPVSYSTSSIEHRSLTRVESHPSALQTIVDAQLVDLGQRILDLPEGDRAEQRRVMATFLNTYQETRHITAQNTSASLSLINRLDGMLRDLEHQTDPNQVRRTEGKLFPSSLSAALVLPPSSGTALIYHEVPLDSLPLNCWVLIPLTRESVMPSEIAFAVHRRGPPSDSAFALLSGVGWETAVL